jgi:hypothetical protein
LRKLENFHELTFADFLKEAGAQSITERITNLFPEPRTLYPKPQTPPFQGFVYHISIFYQYVAPQGQILNSPKPRTSVASR